MFFQSPTEFSMYIENMVIEKKLSHMDAVLLYCKENYVDPEDTKNMLSANLRDKIIEDMKEEGLIKRTKNLDEFL